jgi:hypothetical protein
MKKLLWGIAALVVIAANPATAGQPDPIDTNKLVVKPTRAIADLTSATINLAGDATAGQLKQNGYLKTFNNLFRKPTPNLLQSGPSALPKPGLFKSTQYKNYNTPVMPTSMPVRR